MKLTHYGCIEITNLLLLLRKLDRELHQWHKYLSKKNAEHFVLKVGVPIIKPAAWRFERIRPIHLWNLGLHGIRSRSCAEFTAGINFGRIIFSGQSLRTFYMKLTDLPIFLVLGTSFLQSDSFSNCLSHCNRQNNRRRFRIWPEGWITYILLSNIYPQYPRSL
jgi:hypothetical protein